MRILIVNTIEERKGSAVAAKRLMESLKANGIKVKMLVRNKQTDQTGVVSPDRGWLQIWKFVWERIVIWKANRFKKNFLYDVDIANTGTDITSFPEFQQADIVHLHWINQGMLSLKNIQKILGSGKPVIWTMHDMWPCTGICHFTKGCTNYQQECNYCPYIYGGGGKKDLSTRVFRKKKELYKMAPITFVARNRFLEEQARKSALLSGMTVMSIPNPVNTVHFKPRNKISSRKELDLPQNLRLILFNSSEVTERSFLVDVCKGLVEKYPGLKESVGLVIYGGHSERMQGLFSLPVYALDYMKEERRAHLYNAVDLLVVSFSRENLPGTIMEAMACGLPCVGADAGGIPEVIDHLHNGYIARYRSVEGFVEGIHWILSEPEYEILSREAVRKVETEYSEECVARRYIDLYNKLFQK